MFDLNIPAQHRRFERTRYYIRNVRIALYVLLFIIAFGVGGFMLVADYSLLDAFYMTVITLSTVGFGEIRELDTGGRVFTSFLIIFNLGIFAYAISNISSFLIEGNFQRLIKDYRVFKKIEALQQHVIICGLGRHGREVMSQLLADGQPFVVIESDEAKLEDIRDQGNILYIQGDATHDDILEEAGVTRAAALISTLGEDADNVFIVLTARQLNPNMRIISRALAAKSEAKLLRAGASHVVLPERVGGFYMATMVSKPDVVEFIQLMSKMGTAQLMFEEFEVQRLRPQYQCRTIVEMDIRGITGANIIALHDRNGQYQINPAPDTVIASDMRLVILGNVQQMHTFKSVMLDDAPTPPKSPTPK